MLRMAPFLAASSGGLRLCVAEGAKPLSTLVACASQIGVADFKPKHMPCHRTTLPMSSSSQLQGAVDLEPARPALPGGCSALHLAATLIEERSSLRVPADHTHYAHPDYEHNTYPV